MKTCRQCSQPIEGRTRRALFCSVACKDTWHLQRLRDDTSSRLAGRACVVCGNELTTRSGKARTCSRECSVKWQNAKRREAQLAAWNDRKEPCPNCGNEIPESRWGAIYCSERCKGIVQDARWRERSPGYMRQYHYGISPEDYDALFASQGERCAICGGDDHRAKGWHLDHDHATGKVRGILCGPCNLMLGNANDDPARLLAAAEYLEG